MRHAGGRVEIVARLQALAADGDVARDDIDLLAAEVEVLASVRPLAKRRKKLDPPFASLRSGA
jgi:hypothetical protein